MAKMEHVDVALNDSCLVSCCSTTPDPQELLQSTLEGLKRVFQSVVKRFSTQATAVTGPGVHQAHRPGFAKFPGASDTAGKLLHRHLHGKKLPPATLAAMVGRLRQVCLQQLVSQQVDQQTSRGPECGDRTMWMPPEDNGHRPARKQ